MSCVVPQVSLKNFTSVHTLLFAFAFLSLFHTDVSEFLFEVGACHVWF